MLALPADRCCHAMQHSIQPSGTSTLNWPLVSGSWSHLVKRGCLEVLQRFPVHERVRKTVLLPRGSLSISLVEVPVLSTSPKVAKSLMRAETMHCYRAEHRIFSVRYSYRSVFLARDGCVCRARTQSHPGTHHGRPGQRTPAGSLWGTPQSDRPQIPLRWPSNCMKPGRPLCSVSVRALVWPGDPSIAISPPIRETTNMKGEGLEMLRVATQVFRW